MKSADIVRLELARMLREPGHVGPVLVFLVCGALAIVHGRLVLEGQMEDARSARSFDISAREVIATRGKVSEAGLAAYDLFVHTTHEAAPWASLSMGARETGAIGTKIRLLALEQQLYEGEARNPTLLQRGSFDLAFVLVYLLPLLLIVLGSDVLSSDEERSTGRLVRAQSADLTALLVLRLCVRGGVALVAAVLLLLVGVGSAGHGLGAAGAAWLILVLAYVFFWQGVVAAVAVVARGSALATLVLVTIWVGQTILGPALLNATASRQLPLSVAARLLLQHREAVHTAWDKPREVTYETFFRLRPEWGSTPTVNDRFSWSWYYAMQEAGDQAVRDLSEGYERALEWRQAWAFKLSAIIPPVRTQLLLEQLAGTGLPARLAYLDSVRKYHEQLKRFWYPFIFGGRTLTSEALGRIPAHRFVSPVGDVSFSDVAPLLAGGLAIWPVAALTLRRRSRPR